jgi:putative ABC transport system permease protein
MLNAELPSVTRFSLSFWLVILVAVVLIGLFAGAYPSWYLSRTQTVESLKGKFKSVKGTVNFSRSLIGIQFTISVFILTGALIVSRQIRYFLDKDLGYEPSAVLVITSVPRLWTPEGYLRMESAKREFLQSPVIASMSLSTGSPTGQFSMGGVTAYPSGQSLQQGVNAVLTGTDEDFIRVYGMKMKEGKYFTSGGETEPHAVVINETAQKALSVQLGDKLKFDSSGDIEYPVVGIVRDFNSESLHESVSPVVIQHSREFLTFRHYSIKLSPGNLAAAVQEVERRWRTIFPDDAFVYSFADERIGMLYKTERQMNKAANLASGLMLIIVMTGVLGLVALSVARRTKEIGIRKVLGASAERILMLLSREYVFILLSAFVAGIPLSFWFVSHWLSTFVYHIDLDPWMFVIPVIILFGVTLMMVCAQGITAALSNPVKAIKHE